MLDHDCPLVEKHGIEPWTFCLRDRHATGLRHTLITLYYTTKRKASLQQNYLTFLLVWCLMQRVNRSAS